MSEDLMRYAARMDIRKMGAIMPRRMAHIAQGAPVPPKLDYAANLTARALHPACQKLTVAEIIERGCVITEYPPGSQPIPFHFPERNRLIIHNVIARCEHSDCCTFFERKLCPLDQSLVACFEK